MTGFYGYARTGRHHDPLSPRFLNYSNYEDTRRRIEAAMPEIYCWRCGALADAGWADVTAHGTPFQYTPTHVLCPTPDCFHWDGTKSTTADPPSPVDLRDAANVVMDRFWRQATQSRW